MKLSPKLRWQIGRIIPFGVIWLICSWVFLLTEFAISGFQSVTPDGVIALSPGIVLFASVATIFVGLFVGVLEVSLLKKLFSRYSLGKKIVLKFAFYLCFLFLMNVIFYPLAGSIDQQISPFDIRIWKKFAQFVTSINFLSTMVQISFSLLVSLIYAAISDNLGHNVLLHFFTGRYHKPVKEKRIFMFLDMRSSTAIAEELGHTQYFELLKEYYDAMSDPVINHRGEVYQYIGDEVVVSWSLEKGIANANCLRCFFSIQESFEKRSDQFVKRFHRVPAFKAGLHLGEVTTGEVGALKKEIVFTGDVLNATSRIQSHCNQFETDLLISADLYQRIGHVPGLSFETLGKTSLKGKSAKIDLYKVTEKKA